MKRTLIKLCVFVLAGAIINVAVAWGCVLWLPNPPREYDFRLPRKDVPSHFPQEWHSFANDWLPSQSSSFGIWTKQYERVGMTGQGNYYDYSLLLVQEIRAGWPTRCAWCEGFSDDERGFMPQIKFDWEFAISAPRWIPPRPMTCSFHLVTFRPPVPLCPIWPGFAINTIFYAAILWLLFAAPGFVRGRIRRHRHQCPSCGYPIGASPVCTECGRALPVMPKETPLGARAR